MKKTWITVLIVIASIVTIIASTSTAATNVKGWFGDDNKSTEDVTSSETACVQVVDFAI